MESKNRDIMKYNIRAFPTILFVDHSIDFKILYSGNRTEEDIEVFLYKVFNTEKKTNKELTELDITNIELKEIPVETKNPFSKIIFFITWIVFYFFPNWIKLFTVTTPICIE